MVIRQYTLRGDPRLAVKLPESLVDAVTQEAKVKKSLIRDEIARRLAATFKNDVEYRVRVSLLKQDPIESHASKIYRQNLSCEIMDLLKESAAVERHSLDEEVSLRLQISFMEPGIMGTQSILARITYNIPTQKKLEAEREALLPGRRYVYELQQLELNIRYEDCIPESVQKEKEAIRQRIQNERFRGDE